MNKEISRKDVEELRAEMYKQYIENINKNSMKAFILKSQLVACDILLGDKEWNI